MGWIFIVVFLLARIFVLIPHSIIMGLEANSETTVSVNTSATGYQSYFAICLIIKNDPDIVEWIDYHRKMGCSKFYVHDHSSGPPLNATIASHIESGLVEYSYLQGSFKPNPQIKVYKDCIEKHKDKHTFMGFIDVDEFIVPQNIMKGEKITDVLKVYEQKNSMGGLALNWMIYGYSGFEKRPPNGVLASYFKCTINNHVKTIANLRHVVSPSENTHAFHYAEPYYALNVHGKRVPSAWSDPPTAEVMVIHHYLTKSKEDFQNKMKRGAGDGTFKDMAWFNRVNALMINNCQNFSIDSIPNR